MFDPTPGLVLLKEEETENKTLTGLYVPTNKNVVVKKAKVIKLNEKEQEILSESDIVLYKNDGETPVTIEDEEFILVKIENVLGVLHG